MAYATVVDVENRLNRDLDSDEAQIVSVRLEDAELILKSKIPDLVDRVTAGTLNEDLVVMVEAEAVLRLIRNPDGYAQETDGNYSYQIDSRVASGRLEILKSEWALLGVRAGAYTIRPYMAIPTETSSNPWVTG